MNCPNCGHEAFSLSSSEVRFSSVTSFTAAFACGGCQWRSPAGIANTKQEAVEIAESRLKKIIDIWSTN